MRTIIRSERPAGPAALARRIGAPVLALAVYVAAHLAWLAGQWGGPARRTLIADAFILPIFLVTALAAWRTARHPALAPRVRRAWRWLTLTYALLWVGNVLWTYRDLVPDAGWLTPWGRAFVLASYLPLMAGLLAFPSAPRSPAARLRFALDLATALLGAGLTIWFVVVGASGAASGDAPGTTSAELLDFVAPAADFAVIAAIAALLLGRRDDGGSGGSLRLLAAGHALSVVAGLVCVWLARGAGVWPGHWVDGLWMVSDALMFAAADVQYRQASAGRPAARRPAAPGEFSVLPYVGVALGAVLLLVVTRPWRGGPAGVVVFGAVAVTTLVVARQVLALGDNRRLAAARGESQRALETLLSNLPGMAYRCRNDAHWSMEFVSDGCAELTGHTPAALTGAPGAAPVYYAALIHPDDRARVWDEVQAALAAGTPFQLLYRLTTAGGAERHVWEQGRAVVDAAGAVRALEGIVLDVTERTRAEAERERLEAQRDAERAQLAYLAFHDPLTGLANRALFRDRVEHALARAPGVAVLFLDLDDFKAVNDSLGHGEGDQLLVRVAERLLNATRGCDTVARLGGDEFAVLLENAGGGGEALVVAERILGSFARPVAVGARELAVGASLGIAHARAGDGAEELLRNADVAMYRAKAAGRSRVEVFAPEMYEALCDRLALEGDLRAALAGRDEFRLLYQPILDLHTGAVLGAEALARWEHPARGPVSPAAFIPLAEESGLILPLGRWVLEAACRQAAAWRRALGDAAPYVAVNISGRQLQCPRLVRDVAAALAGAGLPPGALLLEITEGVVMQDTEVNLRRLGELKALGVRLAIDDFGTGYSSLAYLQRFPVDVLKIDKAFVDGVAGGGSDAALARTIIALGETLGLRTVAEGVERAEQAAALRALGCDLAQGYLFARPLPAAGFDEFLAGEAGVLAGDAVPGLDAPERGLVGAGMAA